jgi:glucuronosyltransferase
MKLIVKILATLFIAGQGRCANILYFHGVFSPSHHIWNSALARGLASAGHNVTFLSTDPPKTATKNLHYIVIENGYEILDKLLNSDHDDYDIIKHSQEINKNKFKAATFLVEYAIKSCEAMVSSPSGLDKLLAYPDDFKFDVVINDFTCGSCLLPFLQKFNYPSVIGVSAFLNPPFTDSIVGGHKYPAYVPHYLLNFPQIMSFYQRAYNLAIYTTENL